MAASSASKSGKMCAPRHDTIERQLSCRDKVRHLHRRDHSFEHVPQVDRDLFENDTIASFSVTTNQTPTSTPVPAATVAPTSTARPINPRRLNQRLHHRQRSHQQQPGTDISTSTISVLFGVYPGGGNGELGYVAPPAPETVIAKLNELRGGQSFDIHIYTAWSWYNKQALTSEIEQYTAAGMYVTLTIKYSPPSGQEGNIDGFRTFVEGVIARPWYQPDGSSHRHR